MEDFIIRTFVYAILGMVMGLVTYYMVKSDIKSQKDNSDDNEKKSSDNKKHNVPKKELICMSNKLNETYYTINFKGYDTKVKFKYKADAEFYYNHISDFPIIKWVYEAIHQGPYYILNMDKCWVVMIPYSEFCSSSYQYRTVFDRYGKDRIFTEKNYDSNNTLENKYNHCVDKIFTPTVLLSTEEVKKVEKEVDLAISNNDIKALRQIINDYGKYVELSNKIANKLVDNIKNEQ